MVFEMFPSCIVYCLPQIWLRFCIYMNLNEGRSTVVKSTETAILVFNYQVL